MIPYAFTIEVLEHGACGESPRIIQVDTQCRTTAKGRGFVEVLLNHVLVGDRHVRSDGSQGAVFGQTSADVTAAEGVAAQHVVDVTTVALVEAHHAQG